MRIAEPASRRVEPERARRRPPFREAVRDAARRLVPAPADAASSAPAVRRPASPRPAASPERRAAGGDEQRSHPPPPAPPPWAADPRPAEGSELRALVRALPAAIDAAGLERGAPLALAFGRSLAVELRAVPGGVELVLRADAALARACAGALPELVAAVRRRGIAVARAELRPRAASAGPRVDLPTPLR